MRRDFFRSNKGWAMPLALMIIFVTAILSAVLFTYAMTDNLHVKMETNAEKARYLARSGAEAVVKAWMDTSIPMDQKPAGAVDRIYQLKDGSFKNTTPSPTDEVVGTVDVTVTRITDVNDEEFGCVKFVATAIVNGVTKTAKATSAPYATGQALGWYDYNTGEINRCSDSSNVKNVTFDGNTYQLSYHDPSGIVKCETNGNTELLTKRDNNQNKIAFIANSIFFNPKVDVAENNSWGRQGALILSAQVVCFNSSVRVRKSPTKLNYGTIILDVPEAMGIKLVGHSGVYGKVYFTQGVIYSISRNFLLWETYDDSVIIGNNKAYYFRRRVDGSGNGIGLDVLDWYLNPGEYASDDMIPITSPSDAAPPVPESKVKFVWSW
jgi:hypothetical protein